MKLEVESLSRGCDNISVVGEPGTGKSTLCRGIMASACRVIAERKRSLPYDLAGSSLRETSYFRTMEKSVIKVFLTPACYGHVSGALGQIDTWNVALDGVIKMLNTHYDSVCERISHAADEVSIVNGSTNDREHRVKKVLSKLLDDKVGMGPQTGERAALRSSLDGVLITAVDAILRAFKAGDVTTARQIASRCCDSDIFCDAILRGEPIVALALRELGMFLGRACGHVMSIRTENMKLGIGGKFRTVGSRVGTFECIIPLAGRLAANSDMDELHFEVTAHPMDLTLACMYFAATHVGTLDARFEEGVDNSKTLSGGLSSAILAANQDLSDNATHTGAFVVIEVRNNYSKNGSHRANFDDFVGNDEEISSEASRFMATNEIAIYLQAKGEGQIRRRSFHESCDEYIQSLEWSIDDVRAASDHTHGVVEPDEYVDVMRALGVDPTLMNMQAK